MSYVLLGCVIVALIVFIVWLAKHHQAPSLPAARDFAVSVSSSIEDRFARLESAFAEELSKVPAMVSAEVARLDADLKAAIARAETAEAQLEADRQAHAAALATVAQRVTAAIQSSPELAA